MKSGYQLRCSQCRRNKDRKWKLNNPDKHAASAGKARKEARRLYREGITDIPAKANIWALEDRKKNHEIYLDREQKNRTKQGQLRNTKEVCRRLDIGVSELARLVLASPRSLRGHSAPGRALQGLQLVVG